MESGHDQRRKRKALNKEEALALMQKYCVYQDRCHQEVRYRLLEHQIYGDDLEDIITDLITEDFLNDERFAIAYASGKSKIKKWGKIKISQELKKRNISPYCIKRALSQIDSEAYFDNLIQIIRQRWDGTSTDYHTRNRLTAYAARKGYEYELIKEAINHLQTLDNE